MPLGFQFGFLTETLWQSSESHSPPVSARGLLSGSASVLLTLSPEAIIPSGANSRESKNWTLDAVLAQSRCSTSICWMKEWKARCKHSVMTLQGHRSFTGCLPYAILQIIPFYAEALLIFYLRKLRQKDVGMGFKLHTCFIVDSRFRPASA